MEKIPTVSVIIPTFNRAHLIGRAIKSVLNQTYQDFEIIVVSDASTDNTDEVVNSYNDSRITYIQHNRNRGGSAARNTGIKAAKGEYIGLLDSDDEWLPEKLEKQISKFQTVSENVGVIYSGCCFISEKSIKQVSQVIPHLKGNVHTDLLRNCIFASGTALIRKSCLGKTGLFDEELPSCQDWDIWIRLSKFYEFDFVPDILVNFYFHGCQISADLKAKIKALEWLITKHIAEFTKNPSILSKHLKRLGVLYCLDEGSSTGRKYFLRALGQNPFQKGIYFHFLLSLLAPERHRKKIRELSLSIRNIDGIELYY